MEGELPKEMEVMEVAPEESHECPYCEMTFKGFRSLKTHIGHHFRKGDVRRKLGTGGNVIAKRKKAAKWGSSNQKVSCDICGTVCSNRHSLLRHHMTHTGQKPYKCEACGRGFSANWNLKMHKCTGRPNEADAFTCVDCGKEFTDETMFNDHACGEQHLYETQKTGTPSPSASTSYETPKEEPKGEQLTWDCQFCDRKFMSAKGLGGHMSIHRPQIDTSQSTASVSNTTSEPVKLETTEVQGLFECQFCHRLFNCARGLARHVSVHRIQVGTSENTLPTSSSQITKVEDTGGRSTWDCEFCDRIFTSAKGLGGHMSLHRAQIDTAKSTISSPSHVNQVDGLVQTKWECHMCEKVFTSRKGLCGHMGAHRHRTGTPEHASSSPLLANHTTTSPLLSNCATSLTSLASHEMIIKEESKQTSWECSICQRVFSTPNALGGHMRAHRSASNMLDNVLSPIIRPTLTHHISGDELASTEWECQFCAQLFLDSKSLNEHLYQVHNYQCDTVSPATITATDSSATGAATDSSAYQSPHKCLVCHREFSTPMALGGHMSVHKLKMTPKQKSPKQPAKPKPESPHKSGKPEVPCTVCAKVYQYKASLKRHMSSHAGELGPFKCPHCEETCLLMEDLLVHMDMHQHTKCEICLMTFDQPSLFEQHMKYRHKDLELSSPSKQLPLPETSQVDSSTHILESDSGNAETTLTPKPTAELSAVSPSVNKNAVDWNLRAALSSPPMFSPENATTETVGEQSDGALNLSLRPLQKSESDSVEMQEVSPKLEYDHKEPPKDGKNSLQCQICHQFYPAGLSSIRHKAWHTRRGDKVELGRTNLCKSEKSATPVNKNLENSFRVAIPAHSRENTAIVNTHGVNAPIRVHVKLYPCPVCNKKYTMMQNMQRHLKHAHRKQGVALEKNSTPVKVGDDPPQIMLESISKQEHLPEERKTISLNDEDDGDSVPTWKRYKRGIFKCPICKRAFTWYHNMRTHMKNIHHSTWVTASKSSVKLGQKKQAKCPPPTHKIVDGKKRIICGICNREFVNSSGFGMHMRVHRLKAAKGTSLSLANNVKPESPQVETMQYQSDMKYQPGMQDQPEIPKKRTDSPGPDWENIQFQSEIEYQPGVDYKPEAPKKQTDISRPDQETMPYQSDMEYDPGVRYKPEVPEKQTDSPRPDPEPMHYQSDLEHRPGFQHKTEVLKKQTDSPRPEREPLQHQSDMEYHSGVQYTTEIRKKQTDSPGPDRYFCTTCNQGFFYYCRLKRHIVQQHNSVGIYSKPIKASPPAKIKVKHVTKFFYCHFCPRHFLNTGTLRNHEKWKHPDTGSNSMHLVPILPKPHAETEVHSDPYNVVVKLDPSVTPTADDTLTDTQPGDPTSCSSGFMCQICKKTFSNEDNLMRHIKLHPAHKWLGTTTSTLRKQYKNVATHNISTVYQDGLVACGECGKVFNHTSMLERHKRCHTGEKPFKCPVCASCFTASWSRLVHVKKTHPTYQTANLKRVDKPVVSRHPHPTYPVAKSKTAEDPVLPTGGKSKYWIKDIGGRKVFCCPGCSRSFNNYHALNGHKRHCDYFKKDRLHNINENTNNGPPTPTIIETLQGLIGSDYSDVYDGPFSENQDRPSATNIYKDMNGIEDSYMYNTYSRPNQYIYGDSNGFGTMNIKEEPQDDYPDYCTTSNYVGNGGDSMHDYAEGDSTVHGFGGSKVVDDAIGSMQALSNAIDKFAQSRVLSDSDSEFDDTAPLLIDTEEQPSASYHHSKSYGPTTGHDPHHGSPNTSYQSKDPSPCYDESHPSPSTNYNLLFADAAPLLSDTEEQPSTSYPHTDSYGPTTGHDPDHGSPSTSYQSKDPSICYDESHPRPSTSYNLDDTAPSTSVAGKAEVPHTKEGSLVFKLLSRKNLNDANQNKALMVIKQSVINDRLHGESGFVLGSIHTPMIDMGSDGEVLGYLIGHPTGFGPFCCPVCHRRFPTPSVFANHLMFHVDKCPDVNILANVFRPANDPLHHDDCNCHLFGLTFTSCPKCVEGYTDLDDLKRHVKLHVEQFLECQAAELNL